MPADSNAVFWMGQRVYRGGRPDIVIFRLSTLGQKMDSN
jgi:hypothetical protein